MGVQNTGAIDDGHRSRAIPRAVSREPAALGSCLPILSQSSVPPWDFMVFMDDALDEGGGICETMAVQRSCTRRRVGPFKTDGRPMLGVW